MAKNQKDEVKKSEAVAVSAPAPAPVPVIGATQAMPPGIVVKRRITMPTLAMKTKGDIRYLCIADAMRVSKVVGKIDPTTGKPEKPATICTVGDVLTGEVLTWIVPAVVRANINNEYPDDGYVGKSFVVEHMGKRKEGQRYADFSISEIDVSALTTGARA